MRIAGDRRWALFDRDTGLGLTARRVPELLFSSARLREDGCVEVVLPDGTVTTDETVLSDWLTREPLVLTGVRREHCERETGGVSHAQRS